MHIDYTSSQGINSQASSKNYSAKKDRINYDIRSQYCLVVVEGCKPKVLPTRSAIEFAKSKGLDLIEIGFDKSNQIPITKILDYGKYKYIQQKNEKLAKKTARANEVEIKTIQFSITTDTADRERLVSKAKEFLASGDKVRVLIHFRSRAESSNDKCMKDMLDCILKDLGDAALLDGSPVKTFKDYSVVVRQNKISNNKQ